MKTVLPLLFLALIAGIYARDGERDVIGCGGSARGIVYADRIDGVTHCRHVVR